MKRSANLHVMLSKRRATEPLCRKSKLNSS